MANERRLHIGGKIKKDGWEILDVSDADYVDHKRNANDLAIFEDGTFDALYASHVLEHFEYRFDLVPTLIEWRRVLKDGGKLYVSVPDLRTLCEMFVDDAFSPHDKFHVMRMMFGGHVNEHDFHLVGLDAIFLCNFLEQAGFINISKIESFGLFDDTSEYRLKDILISCNMIAEK
jgi:predicted SAM-dependent methyltransferase